MISTLNYLNDSNYLLISNIKRKKHIYKSFLHTFKCRYLKNSEYCNIIFVFITQTLIQLQIYYHLRNYYLYISLQYIEQIILKFINFVV